MRRPRWPALTEAGALALYSSAVLGGLSAVTAFGMGIYIAVVGSPSHPGLRPVGEIISLSVVTFAAALATALSRVIPAAPPLRHVPSGIFLCAALAAVGAPDAGPLFLVSLVAAAGLSYFAGGRLFKAWRANTGDRDGRTQRTA
jgi:hypothetical protein